MKTIGYRPADSFLLTGHAERRPSTWTGETLRSQRTPLNDKRECLGFDPHLTSPVRLENAEQGRNTVFGSPNSKARQGYPGKARFDLFQKKQKRNKSILGGESPLASLAKGGIRCGCGKGLDY
jgi:hypothetical protein